MIGPQELLAGYANGVFPMARSADDPQLYWFDPRLRGIMPIGGAHLSRSLRQFLRRSGWTATLNEDFAGVIEGCADRPETWINAPLVDLYDQLHQAGFAHSLEIRENGHLVGGIFGITLNGAFFGESMFSRRSNASKLALVWIERHLRDCGFTLFDTQYLTAHLASMGGIEIPRARYRRMLTAALAGDADIMSRPLPGADQLLQEITQTS